MNGQTKTTTNHDEIRRWAEERGGQPVRVRNALPGQPDATDLRISFVRDKYDDTIEEISWEDFFSQFDRDQMTLVYQTETEGGTTSRFARVVRKDQVPQAVIE